LNAAPPAARPSHLGRYGPLIAALKRIWNTPARKIAVSVLALAGAAWLIAHVLRGFSWTLFMTALRATPGWAIAAAVVLTPASYVCLAVTEWFSLHSLGHRLSWHRVARAAFAAYAVSNSLGFSLATGTATRLRLYSAWGLGPGAITTTTLVAGAAVSLSGVVTGGLGLMLRPTGFSEAFHCSPAVIEVVGGVLLSPALLWFLMLRRPAQDRHKVAQSLAGRALALTAAIADWALSGAALYVLLPHPTLSGFPEFLTVFTLGSLVSAATGVPGGVGVFEAVVLGLSALLARANETATALVLYRVIYSLGPLAVMSLMIGGAHLIKRRLGQSA
jgi:phosphatidylglycerol lysyltransferase